VAGEVVYESPLLWDPERPNTTIVTCVDGRWYHHFQEFARLYLKAGTRTDVMAVPGAIEPLTLFDQVPKDFNFFRRRLEGLVEAHATERIVAIAHEDCSWYRARKIGPLTLDLKRQQLQDLRRAAARLRELFAGVKVETYFAKHSPTDPSRIVFELV